MLNRVIFFLISLLFLNSCAELISFIAPEEVNGDYSVGDSYIQVNNINAAGFELSWNEVSHDIRDDSLFNYKLFVTEGNQNSVNNFSNMNMVTKGWSITSYNVTGLNPNTTYSFVVSVSRNDYSSEVYYDIGTITTFSAEFAGVWEMSENGYTSMVMTFNADSYYFENYNEYGNYTGAILGPLTVLNDNKVLMVYESKMDRDGNVNPHDESGTEVLFSWMKSDEKLNIYDDEQNEIMALNLYDGSIDPLYAGVEPIYKYPSNGWTQGEIISDEVVHYKYHVLPGNTYTIMWDDDKVGSGARTLDIKVSAWDEEGTNYFSELDSGFYSPQVITINEGDYIFTLEVESYNPGFAGTYAIIVDELY